VRREGGGEAATEAGSALSGVVLRVACGVWRGGETRPWPPEVNKR
jgi:hypothetical protein